MESCCAKVLTRLFHSAVILVALCSGMPGACAEDSPKISPGNFWEKMSPTERLAFAAGYKYAMQNVNGQAHLAVTHTPEQLAEMLKIGSTALETRKPSSSSKPEVTTYLALLKQVEDMSDFKGVDLDQLYEGVNKFYSDFRNKQISIDWAMYVVQQQVKGTSEKMITIIVEGLRKLAALPR